MSLVHDFRYYNYRSIMQLRLSTHDIGDVHLPADN